MYRIDITIYRYAKTKKPIKANHFGNRGRANQSNHLFAQQLRNKHFLTIYKTGEQDSKAPSKKH